MMRLPAMLACLLLFTAGCSDNAGPSDAPGDAGGHAQETVTARPLQPPDATAFTDSVSVDGTFVLQESAQLNRWAGQAAPVKTHPIDILPQGQAVILTIHAEADTTGDIDTFLDGELEIWRNTCDCPIGPVNDRIYHLRASSPVEFVIQYDEHGQEPSFDYRVDITVQGLNDTFLGQVPIAVSLEAGEAVDTSGGRVIVHGPDDVRIAEVLDGQFVATTSGEHVLFPMDNVRLSSNATAPNARLLSLQNDASGELAVGADFNHGFSAPANSLYIGYCVIAGEATVDPDVELTGPDGILSTSSAPGPHVAGDWGDCTELGTAGLEAYVGDYNLHVTTTASEGTHAFRWVTTWQR